MSDRLTFFGFGVFVFLALNLVAGLCYAFVAEFVLGEAEAPRFMVYWLGGMIVLLVVGALALFGGFALMVWGERA